LRQVLLNLINNAVKFTAHGSISVRASAEEDHVVVMVQDTGLGIPPADQDAIFDEFRQSQRSTARGHGGIGLGLAISKRLIELHQGTIGVYSSGEEGSGSTFYVRLPVAPSTHTDQPIPRQDRQQVILLSRDGAGNGQLDAHLAHNEIQTTALIFDQGGQWLERVIAMTPAAIVLDADLASQAGWTVVKALKEQPATAEIPVLFYALSEEKDRGSLLKVDYVSKDAAASQLTRALARHGLLSTAKSADPTILIVDDEPGLLEAYTSIVRMHLPHCRVRCAQDGAEALQIVCQTQPDLILLDLMMPTMDGFEVMEAIRHGETTRHIPIIVLTGQVLTENDLARLNQGSAAILGKGLFSAQETLSQIDAVLARNKCVSSETQWLVRRAMAYVHDHYAEPISGADIATYVSVSQAHLIRCFNRELGITPVTYLNRWRIKQACAQLEASSDTVTEIAHASGFSSQSYFSRVFKDEMGTSPSAYRRALQQGSGAPMMWPE
jgi:CheY-like chemotaxis protein